MPDDVAEEKVKALLALGAHVERVRPASIVDKKQVRTLPFVPPSFAGLADIMGLPTVRCAYTPATTFWDGSCVLPRTSPANVQRSLALTPATILLTRRRRIGGTSSLLRRLRSSSPRLLTGPPRTVRSWIPRRSVTLRTSPADSSLISSRCGLLPFSRPYLLAHSTSG